MKKLLVLGAGTAGTIIANKLRPVLSERDWAITLVDQDETHYYQPGLLFLPFGDYTRSQIVKPKRQFIPRGVELVMGEIDLVEAEENQVKLVDGSVLGYDVLIIATGTHPTPSETPGLGAGEPGWYESIFDFYTIDGAEALRHKLAAWEGGRLVVNIVDMPIKCPVAPLEFTFLADSFFRERGMRDQVEIEFVTPLPGAFTKPVASRHLGNMLSDRKISLEEDFFLERVDGEEGKLVSYDEREVGFDLLVTVPLNMGAEYIERSGLGDELRHVPVDRCTFLSKEYDNIFALGDANSIPTSKAGSVTHFAVDVFVENFAEYIEGRPMRHQFDGHANCFIESGGGKGTMIDFNYDTEPLTGKYPLPGIGPFSLLEETEMNHWGKLMFKWIYWNVLLPGRSMPLPALMSMAGKIREDEE